MSNAVSIPNTVCVPNAVPVAVVASHPISLILDSFHIPASSSMIDPMLLDAKGDLCYHCVINAF